MGFLLLNIFTIGLHKKLFKNICVDRNNGSKLTSININITFRLKEIKCKSTRWGE